MDDFIDISKINKLPPEKGRVLLSEPFMIDAYFKRSVIYLCEHNTEGTFGFVINNFLDISLSELVESINIPGFKISFGGPVNSSHLYYLHTLGEKIEDSIEIVPGLFTSGNFEQLKTMINTRKIKEHEIRFFLGYSGWDANQLEDEIKENSWIIGNISPDDVIHDFDQNLWKNLLIRMGGKFKIISNFPEDPSLN